MLFILILALLPLTQIPDQPPKEKEEEIRLPNGKLQRDEILKAEHEKSLKDSSDLIRLAQELKADLEKSGSFVVPVQTIRRTEEIEKLAKRIRSRLKHN